MPVAVAKGRATGDSGISPVVCHEKRNLGCARIHTPIGKSLSDLLIKRLQHGGDSSTDYDHIRIEEIDNVSKPWSKYIDAFEQNLSGERVLVGVGLSNDLAVHRRQFSSRQAENHGSSRPVGRNFHPRAASYGGTGCKYFDAASLTTGATRATVVDADVTTLARRPRPPMIDGTIEHNSRSDPGPDGGVENIPEPVRGAPESFGQSGCV